MTEILKWCSESGQPVWKYVVDAEGVEILQFLGEVWKTMKETLDRGLNTEGVLPGKLRLERNAFAAARAIICAEYALLSDGRHRISFDEVVETMRLTGHDLKSSYRETAIGGLAKLGGKQKKPR